MSDEVKFEVSLENETGAPRDGADTPSQPQPLSEGLVAFIQIPDWLAELRDVPATEKLLLGEILTMQKGFGKVWAGIPHLAERIGLKERQTRDIYNDLLKRHWIAEKGRYTAVADWIILGGTPLENGATPPTFGGLPHENGDLPPRSRSGSRSVEKIKEKMAVPFSETATSKPGEEHGDSNSSRGRGDDGAEVRRSGGPEAVSVNIRQSPIHVSTGERKLQEVPVCLPQGSGDVRPRSTRLPKTTTTGDLVGAAEIFKALGDAIGSPPPARSRSAGVK